MRMYDLIEKKKLGMELTTDEIRFMIDGFTDGSIPDYQMSAMTMAICFQGMSKRETVDLTLAMRDSGDVLDLSSIPGVKVDKHSTGGVGDKTSLALTPIIASLGVPVAKMSGRGLGHTGGTIDKLESFPGFTTALPEEIFFKNVREIGIALAGQTANLAPADKKLYALRDVTATVDQMSLIASSIMSKKLASGSDAIVLDVKTGNGAFMKKYEDSVALAKEMVSIGTMAGKKTAAVITDMDQPLGNAVGNAIEVIEAVDTLKGEGPSDFKEVVFALGAQMLLFAGRADSCEEAVKLMQDSIDSGAALDKMAEFVRAQGGDASYVYDTSKFPKTKYSVEVKAAYGGFVHRILAENIGIACMTLGGGRETKDSVIDLSVGIYLKKKNGDAVDTGDTLAVIYANDREKMDAAAEKVLPGIPFRVVHDACRAERNAAGRKRIYLRIKNKIFFSFIQSYMKKNQKEKIINSLELPKDLMLGAAIVTATGRHEVLISNYKGILEYEDSFIKIQTKNCRILISGSHLAIDYYTNEEMKITGFLDTIQYEN